MANNDKNTAKKPRLLIEEWLPIQELGIECGREGSVGLHPPVNRLHVWWARRPLTVSRAAVLGSLLPADFPHAKFLRLMGILGDAVAGRKLVDEVLSGKREKRVKNPYGYERAFTYTPSYDELQSFRQAVTAYWGSGTPTVLDAFAGGGSIPFEAFRLGLPTLSNELNPVASVILKATLNFPAKFGAQFASQIEKWGKVVETNVESNLNLCFPRRHEESDLCYIWVRTVACPQCGLIVPLSPNWWLDKKAGLGYKLQLPAKGSNTCTFKIARSGENGFNPDKGTVDGGKAQCPRDPNHILEGEYIKAEAQAGRMGHQLAAIGYKTKNEKGRHFREATDQDLKGVENAERMIKEKLPEWEAKGWVPNEDIPEGEKTNEPRRSGFLYWKDLFSPRQLLVHLTTLEAIKSLPLEDELDPETAKTVRTYLAIVFDKTLDYGSVLTIWDSTYVKVTHVFDRHDFAFTWSYGEIDGASQLWRWALEQVLDAYKDLAKLLPTWSKDTPAIMLYGDAASMSSIPDKSVPCVVTDPPYSGNVMYAELSDYFYVWMKRLLGDVYPELFESTLTDKDKEAVANAARFKDFDSSAKLAEQDYEAKMLNAFKEIHRVLRDDGVLTVMFTHKSNDAWNALGRSLIEAGFEITATWPIKTESEHSLHQAGKIAASSTIILVCRKRSMVPATRGWWEETRPILYDKAYSRAKELSEQGVRGVDLQISTYGPALQVISSRWPVVDRSGAEVSPIKAIEEASKASIDFRLTQLTRYRGDIDKPTLFYIDAVDSFWGRLIPPDEAVKLSHVLNVDIDELRRKYAVAEKKGNVIRLPTAEERRKAGKFLINGKFSGSITLDKIHAAEITYQDKGARGVKQLYDSTDFLADQSYLAAFEALLNALPPSDPEYAVLSDVARYLMKGKVEVKHTADPEAKQLKLEDFGDNDKTGGTRTRGS